MKKVTKTKSSKVIKKDMNSPKVQNIRNLLYTCLFEIKNKQLEVDAANSISKMAKTFLETYKIVNNKYVVFKKEN
jgi:hypothetical protein